MKALNLITGEHGDVVDEFTEGGVDKVVFESDDDGSTCKSVWLKAEVIDVEKT